MALMDSFSAHVLLDQISFQDVLELRFFSIFDFHNFHMGFINNKKNVICILDLKFNPNS